ncbi:hypothetical protein RRF57_008688 [Xylaria bambusicola]|uniref:Uncharacterized protein n=1 Tax=Xylaria bambusicola TaxID=326684 RepID=A0AAN7V1Z4_9PEZI
MDRTGVLGNKVLWERDLRFLWVKQLGFLRGNLLILDFEDLLVVQVINGRATRRKGSLIRRTSGLPIRVGTSRRKRCVVAHAINSFLAVNVISRLGRCWRSEYRLWYRRDGELGAG